MSIAHDRPVDLSHLHVNCDICGKPIRGVPCFFKDNLVCDACLYDLEHPNRDVRYNLAKHSAGLVAVAGVLDTVALIGPVSDYLAHTPMYPSIIDALGLFSAVAISALLYKIHARI